MQPERLIQRAVRARFKYHGFETVSVPNGSVLAGDQLKRARQMSTLKADGLLPGFSDLLVYGTDGRVGHCEVKTEGGRQQPSQKAVQAWLESIGHLYAICRSTADVDETLARWGWIGETE